MAVSSTITEKTYRPGSGSNPEALSGLTFTDPSHIVVEHSPATGGAPSILTLGVDYTLTGEGATGNASITATADYPAEDRLRVYRQSPRVQPDDFRADEEFPVKTVEGRLDALARVDQEQEREIDRTVRAPRGEAGPLLPSVAERDGKLAKFDGADIVALDVDEVTAEATARAEAAARQSELASALSIALNGEVYDDTILGLAATNPGDFFAVDGGGDIVLIYLNDNNVDAVFQRTAPTVEYLERSGTWATPFSWMTEAEIAAVKAFDDTVDVTAPFQAAINETHAAGINLVVPWGRYNISATLNFPGQAAPEGAGSESDDRNKMWRMMGMGLGELFARSMTAGTIIAGVPSMNAPLFDTNPLQPKQGVGNIQVWGVRWEVTNPTQTEPVVKLRSLINKSAWHDNGHFQAGTGNGVEIDFCPVAAIRDCYILSDRWNINDPNYDPADVVGVGLQIRNVADGGLFRVDGVHCVGWDWGFKIGDTATGFNGQAISFVMRDCEVSNCRNGLWLTANARSCLIENLYTEGGTKDGTGILNEGSYNVITACNILPGFVRGIDHQNGFGTTYIGNLIGLGRLGTAANNPVGMRIRDDNRSVRIVGGQIVGDNSAGPVVNAKGIVIEGNNPHIDIDGVQFGPTDWNLLGAGAVKIDTSAVVGTVRGNLPTQFGILQQPHHIGSVSTPPPADALDEDDMTGNALNVPRGSFFRFTPSVPVTVNEIRLADRPAPGTILRLAINENVTLQNTGLLRLIGQANMVGSVSMNLITLFDMGTGSPVWVEQNRWEAP